MQSSKKQSDSVGEQASACYGVGVERRDDKGSVHRSFMGLMGLDPIEVVAWIYKYVKIHRSYTHTHTHMHKDDFTELLNRTKWKCCERKSSWGIWALRVQFGPASGGYTKQNQVKFTFLRFLETKPVTVWQRFQLNCFLLRGLPDYLGLTHTK